MSYSLRTKPPNGEPTRSWRRAVSGRLSAMGLAPWVFSAPPDALSRRVRRRRLWMPLNMSKKAGDQFQPTATLFAAPWSNLMTDQHPITPPPELVASLRNSAPHRIGDSGVNRETWLIHNAYALGADQELEACCEWTQCYAECGDSLRNARRPKQPSLKEQALMALEDGDLGPGASLTPVEVCIIRRALEALPND